MSRRALFLDRDGVINHDLGYVHRPDQVEFVDGIFDLARAAVRRGYLLVVVTNQAGIGRGLYTEDDFHALSAWIGARFAAEGAPIGDVFFAPHHPLHGIGHYRQDHPDRKPGPGMILRAAARHGIDLARSILVGDKDSDIMAGRAAGVGTLVFFAPGGDNAGSDAINVRSLAEVIPLLAADTAGA
jgi:D-glycero-D-manno-heptose 1,7-bisphosphate phosphatase